MLFRSLSVLLWFVPAASLLHSPPAGWNADTDRDQGQAIAQKIEEELESAREQNAAEPPSFLRRQPPAGKGGEAVEAQTRLMKSQLAFNRASSAGRSEEEQAIEKALATAMKSPPQVGKPQMSLPSDTELACLPDVNRCPRGWDLHGSLCIATSSYGGSCKRSSALFDMNVDERLAFARYCQAEFHCQEDCPQNFAAACPSLWTEVSANVCEAPSNYVGSCARRVSTDALTDKDKETFGFKCGARWPCAPPPERVYSDVCPQGWVLQFGQTCMAPPDYHGPCGTYVRMHGLTKLDKQVFEAACSASWPSTGRRCERDYSAPCPEGWRQRIRKGKVECISPPAYVGCSRVQRFDGSTLVEKQRWERNCQQQFPCRGANPPDMALTTPDRKSVV